MTAREQGATAYRVDRLAFEMNPFLNDPTRASRCELSTWPKDAQDWHRGWVDEATRIADEAKKKPR